MDVIGILLFFASCFVVVAADIFSDSTYGEDAQENFLFGQFWWDQTSTDPELMMTTPEIIRAEGYPAEAHVILTDDGYLLTMHRIPGSPNSPVAFLQHGLLGSSSDFVITGKEKGLAFILADQGYDVWLGNARGNTYSRSHINYTTSDLRYWDFSWHEMGIYDLPAEISYVTKMRAADIVYIGHSMGTSMFYVMAIEKPEIASHIKAMFSLAPIAFLNHMKSPIRLLTPFWSEVEFILNFFGRGEFLPQNVIIKLLSKYGCSIDTTEERICANTLFAICGFDPIQANYTLIPIILNHTPAGTSTKTLVHFGQEVQSGKFRNYDYGREGNIERYNSKEPPNYDITKIQVPVALFWSDNDWLASPIDVHRLSDLLPKKIISYRINFDKFNHLDFLWAKDAPSLVYSELLSLMQKYR